MSQRCLALLIAFTTVARAQENLADPPVTTSKAWAVADGQTGEIIASHQLDQPLKAASTTKVMCAYVIFELAKQNPAVLDEVVTISKLADDTPGSTADLHAGEKVTVRDGLYGMLLPSGNDIGNAFAEHFSPRLDPPGKDAPPSIRKPEYNTRRNFIAEMNRAAARLGMKHTIYRQSYGDGGTDTDRTTTARDLLTLGRAAMQHALFREMVKTKTYTGKARMPDGTERDADWKNSNALLALGDYDGIKTGLTNSAGHCLLASGTKNGVSLMVVILGGITDEARYADARNLFRWRWAMAGLR